MVNLYLIFIQKKQKKKKNKQDGEERFTVSHLYFSLGLTKFLCFYNANFLFASSVDSSHLSRPDRMMVLKEMTRRHYIDLSKNNAGKTQLFISSFWPVIYVFIFSKGFGA